MKPVFKVLALFGLIAAAAVWYTSIPWFVYGLFETFQNFRQVRTEVFTHQTRQSTHREEPFRVLMGQGSGLYGYDVLSVSESGVCVLYKMDGLRKVGWSVYEYSVDPTVVLGIKKEAERLRLSEKPSSTSADVHDGSQWFAKVWVGGERLAFSCNNSFPWYLVALSRRLESCLPPDSLPRSRRIENVLEFREEIKDLGSGPEHCFE